MSKLTLIVALLLACFLSLEAFSVLPLSRVGPATPYKTVSKRNVATLLSMSESSPEESGTATEEEEEDPMAEAMMDAETRLQLEKQRRADELRAQEVFMTKSTGKFKCTNCDWEYDESTGDSMMIGGTVKPGTAFDELPNNWRCPVCRASKDSFTEVVVEIPGFEVNQGYGLGGNSMTADQKNTLIFGGLLLFFVLFIAGYGLS